MFTGCKLIVLFTLQTDFYGVLEPPQRGSSNEPNPLHPNPHKHTQKLFGELLRKFYNLSSANNFLRTINNYKTRSNFKRDVKIKTVRKTNILIYQVGIEWKFRCHYELILYIFLIYWCDTSFTKPLMLNGVCG